MSVILLPNQIDHGINQLVVGHQFVGASHERIVFVIWAIAGAVLAFELFYLVKWLGIRERRGHQRASPTISKSTRLPFEGIG